VALVKHNRYMDMEVVLKHRQTPLSSPDFSGKFKEKLVLLFNDGIAVIEDHKPRKEYILHAFIYWASKRKKLHSVLNTNVNKLTFSVTDPREEILHTFECESEEQKEIITTQIKSNASNWQSNVLKEIEFAKQTAQHFKGVVFEILFTVPVASATEKPFTVYAVEMTTEFGKVSILKRYRQLLHLHHTLQRYYPDVPSFPPKKYFGDNTSPKFIKKRCRKLTKYLNQAFQLPGILEIDEVRTFLTTTTSHKGEDEQALIDYAKYKDAERVKEANEVIASKRRSTLTETPVTSMSMYLPNSTQDEKMTMTEELPKQDNNNPTDILPKPENTIMKVLVLWDFIGETDRELDLHEGDTVAVQEETDSEWWFGMSLRTGRYGFFPSAFVKVLRYY